MKSFEVIDNFLDNETFYWFKKQIESGDFYWCFTNYVNESNIKNTFVFADIKVQSFQFVENPNFNYVDVIMKELKKRNSSNTFQVTRAKANLFLKNDTQIKYGHHYDINDSNIEYETIIYYVNNNNGGTEFEDGTFIKQKENRALIIYGKQLHQSIGQTDELRRINININYYRK